MFRHRSLLLLLCGCLVGCQSALSFGKWSASEEDIPIDKVGVDFDFNVNDTIDPNGQRQRWGKLAGHEDPFLREEIIATARGSQVGVSDESGGRYCGTVLRAGPDRIEMMNCLSQEVIPGPDGQKQCKKSHIPFLTIKTSAVTHFVTIAPPPPGFPETDEEIDPSEYTVAEIVNRSGTRQHWGRVPESGPSNSDEGIATVKQ